MMLSLSELELSRLRRKPSCVYALLFSPREIDLSLKIRAYEDAIMRTTGIPARLLVQTGKLRPSISRDARADELEIGSTIPYIQEKPFLGSVNGKNPRGIRRFLK